MTDSPNPQPQVKALYVRKRDKIVCRVERATSRTVLYCELPELIVWSTTRKAFANKFRPATAEESQIYLAPLAVQTAE